MEPAVVAAFTAAASAIAVALINAWSNRKNCKAVDMAALKDAFDEHIRQDNARLDTLERHSEENYKASLRTVFKDNPCRSGSARKRPENTSTAATTARGRWKRRPCCGATRRSWKGGCMEMTEFIAGIIGAVAGAGIFAAGAWFRHRCIRPEPQGVRLPAGENPWEMIK